VDHTTMERLARLSSTCVKGMTIGVRSGGRGAAAPPAWKFSG